MVRGALFLFALLALFAFVRADEDQQVITVNPVKCSKDMAQLGVDLAKTKASFGGISEACGNNQTLVCTQALAVFIGNLADTAATFEAAEQDCKDQGSACLESVAVVIEDIADLVAQTAQTIIDCSQKHHVKCTKDIVGLKVLFSKSQDDSDNCKATCGSD